MAFIPFSSDTKSAEMALTVDNRGRIYLNAAMRNELGLKKGKTSLYLFFDKETRRIGVAETYKQGSLARVAPFHFDKRFYTWAIDFLDHHNIEYREGAVKYFYDGMEVGVMTFKSVRHKEQPGLKFRIEKSGSIEAM